MWRKGLGLAMFFSGMILIGGLSGIVSSHAAPTPKGEVKADKTVSGKDAIKRALDSVVNFELKDVTVAHVLNQLSEEHKINIILDKNTINQMGLESEDLPVDIKIKNVKLRSGLRSMLHQHNLTYVAIGDTLVVTTEEMALSRQLKQRVNLDYENVPLNKIVRELVAEYGVNIVVDPRTIKSKAIEAQVSAQLDDVPLEAAVRLICEMASLKPARLGNIIYITTEERADKLKDTELVPHPSAINPFNPGNVPGFGGGIGGGNVQAVPPQIAVPAMKEPAPEVQPSPKDAPVAPKEVSPAPKAVPN